MVKVEVLKRETGVTGSTLYRGDVVDIPEKIIVKYPGEFRVMGEPSKARSDKRNAGKVSGRKKEKKELADELGETLGKKRVTYFKKNGD